MNFTSRFLAMLMLLLPPALLAQEQQQRVRGLVKDEAGVHLPGTYISLLHLPDSAAIETVVTDSNGFFVLKAKPGSYALKASFMGYVTATRLVRVTDKEVFTGVISLQPRTTGLKEVRVEERITPVIQKGDTTEYHAGAYKTNPDATADDLVQKLPGVVNQDGKVQVQGEDVKQVLVDGKPFFGDDPSAVLRNLPAEVIEKIQVFDQQSDQAQFTGFKDGNTTKTINIITRASMRNASFGKAYAGYGTDNTYKAGAVLNKFSKKRRISVLMQSNNINEQNFSSDDLLGVLSSSSQGGGRQGAMGGAGMPGGGGRGGPGGGGDAAGNFLVDQKSGISTTHAGAINYNEQFTKKLELTGSYFFNMSDNNSDQSIYRQYIMPGDSLQFYTQQTLNNSRNINHRVNIKIEFKPDSFISFQLRPRISFQQNDGSSNTGGETQRLDVLLNNTQNKYGSNLDAVNFNNDFLFRHKFKKEMRTFSINVNTGYNSRTGNSNLHAQNNFYSGQNLSDTLDQDANLDKKGWSYGTNTTYTEPVTKKSALQFTHNFSYTHNQSDKRTYNQATATTPEQQDTSLSNVFESTYQSQAGGLGYRYETPKTNFNLSMNYQWARLDNDQQFPVAGTLHREFVNLLPSAMYRHEFSAKRNLRINYRTSTTAPTVDQLQSVVNNSNPVQLSTGNPNLKQNYQHSLFMRYSSANAAKSTSLFMLLMGSYTQNYIGNSTSIAAHDTLLGGNYLMPEGAQLSSPVNMDGYYTMRAFTAYTMPVKLLKSNLNINLTWNYTRTPGLINNAINYARSPSFAAGLVLSSNISEKLDFTISSTSTFSKVTNSLRSNLNSNYFNQLSRFKFNWLFGNGFVFQTELNHQLYTGLSSSYNLNFLLWNAGFGKKFMKQKQAELRVTVFDLLKQNNSIQRSSTDTYIQDQQSNVLQQYFMLTFTYNLKPVRKAPAGNMQK